MKITDEQWAGAIRRCMAQKSYGKIISCELCGILCVDDFLPMCDNCICSRYVKQLIPDGLPSNIDPDDYPCVQIATFRGIELQKNPGKVRQELWAMLAWLEGENDEN